MSGSQRRENTSKRPKGIKAGRPGPILQHDGRHGLLKATNHSKQNRQRTARNGVHGQRSTTSILLKDYDDLDEDIKVVQEELKCVTIIIN